MLTQTKTRDGMDVILIDENGRSRAVLPDEFRQMFNRDESRAREAVVSLLNHHRVPVRAGHLRLARDINPEASDVS
jgi:hypothetical protein